MIKRIALVLLLTTYVSTVFAAKMDTYLPLGTPATSDDFIMVWDDSAAEPASRVPFDGDVGHSVRGDGTVGTPAVAGVYGGDWDDDPYAASKNDIYDKIELVVADVLVNTGKAANVPTALSLGTITPTTVAITSDGGADDVVIPEADTDDAGLLGASLWDSIAAALTKLAGIEDNAKDDQDLSGLAPKASPTFTGTVVIPNITGADTNLVSGTAGTNGNCSEWNVDGDLVDAGAPCGSGGGDLTADELAAIQNGENPSSTNEFITASAVSGLGGGDVGGPDGVVADGGIARYDDTTGKLIQDSLVIIDDTGNISGASLITSVNLDNYVPAITKMKRFGTALDEDMTGYDGGVAIGAAVKHGGTYYLFYNGQPQWPVAPETPRVFVPGYATSTDKQNWVDQGIITGITASTAGAGFGEAFDWIFIQDIIKKGATYYMLVAGPLTERGTPPDYLNTEKNPKIVFTTTTPNNPASWVYHSQFLSTTALGLPNYCANSSAVYGGDIADGGDDYWYTTNSCIPDLAAAVWYETIIMMRIHDDDFPGDVAGDHGTPVNWEIIDGGDGGMVANGDGTWHIDNTLKGGLMLNPAADRWASSGVDTFFDSKIFKIADYFVIYAGHTTQSSSPGNTATNFNRAQGRYFYSKNPTGPYNTLPGAVILTDQAISTNYEGRSAHILEDNVLYTYIDGVSTPASNKMRVWTYSNDLALDNLEDIIPVDNQAMVWGPRGSHLSEMIYEDNVGLRVWSESITAARGIVVGESIDSDVYGATISYYRDRGIDEENPVIVQDGDVIAVNIAWPFDGDKYLPNSTYGYRVDGSPEVDSVPLAFFLKTGPNFAGSLDRLVIAPDGTVTIPDLATGGADEPVCVDEDGLLLTGCAVGGASNSFVTHSLPAGTDPVATTSTDTLIYTRQDGIDILGSGSKTIDFSYNATDAASSNETAMDIQNMGTISSGQLPSTAARNNGEVFTFVNNFGGAISLEVPNGTIASLPGSPTLGRVAIISDGISATDCSVGSGSTKVLCFDNGSEWVSSGAKLVTDLGGTSNRVVYVDSSGDTQEVILGASGTYLGSTGPTTAPAFSAPPGSDVSKSGTASDNQVAVWTGDGPIEGDAGLTFDKAIGSLGIWSSSTGGGRGLVIGENVDNIHASSIWNYRSRGTKGSEETLVLDDLIATYFSFGHDGTQYLATGQTGFIVDASTSTGSVPTAFYINTGSTSFGVKRLQVSSDGDTTLFGGLILDNGVTTCLMMRDSDDGTSWTECNTSDGVMSCSVDADGICDGS
jgi:hypothetical protein